MSASGTCSWRKERLNDALASYEGKHRIISALAAQDPSNADWQRDLAVDYERLGDMEVQRGDDEAAAGYFRRALESASRS